MRNFKQYAIVPLLVLVAIFMIAARSAERSSPKDSQPALAIQHVQGSMGVNDLSAPTSGEPAASARIEDSKPNVETTGRALSLKEKVAAKIVAKQAKKEMRKAEAGKASGGKSQLVALLLCFFVGWLGIHRFYLGYTGLGVLMLLTGGLCGLLILIDFIRILVGDLGPKGGEYGETL